MGNDKLFQKRKIRKEESLKRKKAQRLKLKNILIVSEGLTEFNYFNDIRRSLRGKRINIILEKPRGSAPINVVDLAIDFCKKNEGIDFAFCVIDKDEHTTFSEALSKLKSYMPPKSAKSKAEFKAIVSVPCFEVWLILHFSYTTKSYARKGSKSPAENVLSDLTKQFPEYSKSLPDLYTKLNAKLDTAIENAKRLQKQNKQDESDNPLTNMHELIEFIKDIAKE